MKKNEPTSDKIINLCLLMQTCCTDGTKDTFPVPRFGHPPMFFMYLDEDDRKTVTKTLELAQRIAPSRFLSEGDLLAIHAAVIDLHRAIVLWNGSTDRDHSLLWNLRRIIDRSERITKECEAKDKRLRLAEMQRIANLDGVA